MENEAAINPLIEAIESISNAVHSQQKFNIASVESMTGFTNILATYLECTDRQAFWFAIFFGISLQRPEIDLDDIANYTKCSILTIFKYVEDFEALVKLKLLRKERSERRRRKMPDRFDTLKYYLPTHVLQAVAQNTKVKPVRMKQEMTVYELLDEYKCWIIERNNEVITRDEFDNEVENLLHENRNLPLVKSLMGLKLDSVDISILLYVFTEFVDFNDCDLTAFLRIIFNETMIQMRIKRQFLSGTNRLQELKLVVSPDGDFKSDKSLVLTDYAKELFFGKDKDLFATQEQKTKRDIILASEIITKKLFYNKNEEESLNQLTELLKPDNFAAICNRMNDLGLRTGFNILLFGPAGTGKTESCLQLAKNSGRDLYKVAIEGTKNMYFGESEKLIKGIFDRYAKMVEKNGISPILLWNEVDGLLTRRNSSPNSSSVTQTMNTMQNLLLEGMETIKGIILATTNLVQNLDPAFERRFLYKIELKKPDFETRILIWQDKIAGLHDKDYHKLADNFDFSGGQIENITRKVVLNQVLTGYVPSIEQILKYCTEESLVKNVDRTRIGFVR